MANQVSLNIFDTIKTAWSQVKGSKGSFWMVVLFIFITSLIYQGFHFLEKAPFSHPLMLLWAVLACITTLFEFMLLFGLIYLGVQRAANLDIRYTMIKNVLTLEIFLKCIGYILLIYVLFIPAFILMIIAVVLSHYAISHVESHLLFQLISAACYVIAFIYMVTILLRLYVAKVFIAVEKLNPWLAIKRSFQATQSNAWKLLGLLVINIIIVAVSAIPFGVGLIWTLPYLYINYGLVYRRLAVSATK